MLKHSRMDVDSDVSGRVAWRAAKILEKADREKTDLIVLWIYITTLTSLLTAFSQV